VATSAEDVARGIGAVLTGGTSELAYYGVKEIGEKQKAKSEAAHAVTQAKLDKSAAQRAEKEAIAAEKAAKAAGENAEAMKKAAEASKVAAAAKEKADASQARLVKETAISAGKQITTEAQAFTKKLEAVKPFAIGGLIAAAISGGLYFYFRK
jgi:hypothetical protein